MWVWKNQNQLKGNLFSKPGSMEYRFKNVHVMMSGWDLERERERETICVYEREKRDDDKNVRKFSLISNTMQ